MKARQIAAAVAACMTGATLCAAQTNLLRNGTMEAGSGVPEAWGDRWGSSSAIVARDTGIRRSGGAALRVEPRGADIKAVQWIEGVAGRKHRLDGAMRVAGGAKAQVYNQSFDAGMTVNKFQQIRYLEGNADWVTFSGTVEIPREHTRMVIGLMAEGQGQAWMDDLVLTEVTVPPAQPTSYSPAASAARPGPQMNIIRDFASTRFDYYYGESWKDGSTVRAGSDRGTQYVQIDATEHGGGGLQLNGVNLAPAGQTHLALRARLMLGHGGGQIRINIIGDQNQKTTVDLPVSYLNTSDFRTVAVRLPAGDFGRVQQIQIQGNNFSNSAAPFKVQIASVGTITPADAGGR